jgi:hypothetical protein
VVFAAIRKLMEPAAIPPGRRIGFTAQGLGEGAASSQQCCPFSPRVLPVGFCASGPDLCQLRREFCASVASGCWPNASASTT